jgi:hypothetical protein
MTIRVQCTLKATSGLVKDDVVNAWHTAGAKGDPADDNDVAQLFADFYNAWGGAIANSVRRELGLEVSMYNLADAEPRAPFFLNFYDIPNADSGSDLPREVALCTSIRGELVSGSNPARRRGRAYLGPFISSANSGTGRPDSGLVDDVTTATGVLAEQLLALEDGIRQLVVWSRRSNQAVHVVAGWVDNAWDTQRRRGLDPLAREQWSIG